MAQSYVTFLRRQITMSLRRAGKAQQRAAKWSAHARELFRNAMDYPYGGFDPNYIATWQRIAANEYAEARRNYDRAIALRIELAERLQGIARKPR